MAHSVQRPLVGQIARYEGVYRPHWEIGHIGIRVTRTRKLLGGAVPALGFLGAFWLGLIGPIEAAVFTGLLVGLAAMPAEEWWSPAFPPEFEGGLDDEGGPIEFEGIVTERGRYGHKGVMRRRVEIVRILLYHRR
jgi:hypothetical protein